MYKVSIIVPVYNTEKHLPRCLDSIAAQSLDRIECVIVSDCSPGNCDEIVNRYRDELSINYVCLPKNKGTLMARIAGAKAATGEYIGYIDSDDYASKDMYKVLYEKAVSENADIVHCHAFEISNKGKKIWQEGIPKIQEAIGNDVFERFLNFDIIWGVWDKLFRKDILQTAVNILPESRLLLNDDLIIFFSAAFHAKKYVSINDALYYYMRNDDSITASDNEKVFFETINTCNAIFSIVERLDCFEKLKKSTFFTYGVLYWLFHSLNNLNNVDDYLDYLVEKLNVDTKWLFRLLVKWEKEIGFLQRSDCKKHQQIEKPIKHKIGAAMPRARVFYIQIKALLKAKFFKTGEPLQRLWSRLASKR